MARWALLEVSVYDNTIRRRWRPPGASWIFNDSTGFPYRLEYRTTTGRLIRREKRFHCLRVAEQAAEEQVSHRAPDGERHALEPPEGPSADIADGAHSQDEDQAEECGDEFEAAAARGMSWR